MNFLVLALAMLAVAGTQVLSGGRYIGLCLPAYGLLAVAAVIGWWPTRRRPIPRGSGECLAAAGFFFAYITIRASFSPEEYLARNDLYVALGAMALYLLVALTLTSTKLRLIFVAGLLVLAVANCVIGAVQYFHGHEFMPLAFLPRGEYESRASGFYGYPNFLAAFLEITLLLGLGIAFWSRWPIWAKMLVGYVCAMCLLCLLATGSRGGYISCAVGLLVFVLTSLVLVGKLAKGRVIALLLAGLLLLGGAALGVRKAMASSFLIHSRSGETLTVDAFRMQLWQAAWKQFRLQPVVGTGSGTYRYYGRQFRHPLVRRDPVNAHNDYFELLAEYGLIGLVGAVIFLETHLRRGWTWFTRRLSADTDLEGLTSDSVALTIGALSAAAACLVHSLLDFTLHIPVNMLVAAFVFGLLANPRESARSANDPAQLMGWPAGLRIAAPLLGLFMVGRMLPTAVGDYCTVRAHLIFVDWRHFESEELSRQMEAFARRGLTADPRNPALYHALAEAHRVQGELATDPAIKDAFYTQAVEDYTKALECAPGDVTYVLALGCQLDALRRFSESDSLFERALQLDPNGGPTHMTVGGHLSLEGKLPEAAAEFRLAVSLGAGPGAEAGLANVTEELKAKGASEPGNPGDAR